jgi:aminoglycoside phosphotransferase (APT) family kinase protein
VYSLSLDDVELPYLMRVAKPVDPFYKTASEVSTIAFIQQYTSIPVPNIIDFSATSQNSIGLERILMQRMTGSALISISWI